MLTTRKKYFDDFSMPEEPNMYRLPLPPTHSLMGSAIAACLIIATPSTALAVLDGECISDPLRQPLFGQTHLHTGMSHDASTRFVPTTPRQAYAFAKGEESIGWVNENGFIEENQITIDRPLDWGAVTDHSEFFTEMGLCKYDQIEGAATPPDEVLNSLDCQILTGSYLKPLSPDEERYNLPGGDISTAIDSALEFIGTFSVRPSSRNAHLPVGETPNDSLWQEMQAAAEEANDPCMFTSFIGYEMTSAPSGTNWHRNVIFANDQVIDRPISAIDLARKDGEGPPYTIPPRYFGAPDITKLWNGLQSQCLDNDEKPGCDVITIPHNPNLGGGIRFMGNEYVPPLFFDPKGTEEEQKQHSKQRQKFEPIVEIYQSKGSSECRWDPRQRAGVDTNDEFCNFELMDITAIGATTTNLDTQAPDVNTINPRSYVRNVLKDGLKFKQQLGVNPFKLGIIADSDSHNGDMGWHPEDERFKGHSGIKDSIPSASPAIQASSGGFSVVWAKSNTRESIFAALKRREVYGTSGTRIQVRFFGGWDFSAVSCESGDALIQTGYADGVPMGGDLRSDSTSDAPQFIVQAQMDDFIGTPLDRIQIIKGWVDSDGETHEKVIHVAGSAATDTDVVGQTGHKVLCDIYTDTDFDPAQPAFYYARVLEKPVYRYSTLYCEANFGFSGREPEICEEKLYALQNSDDENDVITAMNASFCCSDETTNFIVQPVIQERAWTSPIWYTPSHLLISEAFN